MAHLRHPARHRGDAWGGKYRGQKQKWYALRFTGDDGEINISEPGGGHEPEFVEWRWVAMRELADLVVPFKRSIYERVVKEFSQFASVNAQWLAPLSAAAVPVKCRSTALK